MSRLGSVAAVTAWGLLIGGCGNASGPDSNGDDGPLGIQRRVLSALTPAQDAALQAAVSRWHAHVLEGLPDVSFVNNPLPADACGVTHPELAEVVDDLLIFIVVEPIDGPDGTVAEAGPCRVRTGSLLPVVGLMRFDSDDLDRLEADGDLTEAMVHEMGHVLGIGALWGELGLLQDPSDPANGGTPGADAHFDGTQAIAAFDDVGGLTYVGPKVPAENDGAAFGTGSLDIHWREAVFGTELMTPRIDRGVLNELSVVSVASLADLGYAVSTAGVDAYALPAGAAAARAASADRAGGVDLAGDVWMGPVYRVDPDGRVVGALRR